MTVVPTRQPSNVCSHSCNSLPEDGQLNCPKRSENNKILKKYLPYNPIESKRIKIIYTMNGGESFRKIF
jgi:hypothetical protein